MEDKKMVTKSPYFGTEVKAPISPRHKPPAEPIPEEPKPEKPVAEKPTSEKKEPATDLLAELAQKKPTGKGCNIYLDADVIEKLDKLAKQAKTSRSKVINTLLRNLLADK